MTTPGDGGPRSQGSVRVGRASAMPSMQLLRSLTDEHVLAAVIEHGRLTRAEISAATGISKPTISESVRRLVEADIVVDTGERTTGRGRVGSYYTLSDSAGTALIVTMRPDGVRAEAVDPFGTTRGESLVALGAGAGHDEAARALARVARNVTTGSGRFRLAVVSAADPVDRATGRLVQLPDAPFLVGELDPVAVLAPMVSGPVFVDNDVNWAARAELDAGADRKENFVYLHLGEGLGCAVVVDGDVIHGYRGLAGEIAHLVTIGPEGRAMPLTDVFARLGLRRPGTTAVDVDRLIAGLDQQQPEGISTLQVLARALSGVVAAAIALTDPELIVLGGPWGGQPSIRAALTTCLETSPRPVTVHTTAHADSPDHTGARLHGLTELRTTIVTRT